jgi:hypothetical protein
VSCFPVFRCPPGIVERKLDHGDGALKRRGLLKDCLCILAVIAGLLRCNAWGARSFGWRPISNLLRL